MSRLSKTVLIGSVAVVVAFAALAYTRISFAVRQSADEHDEFKIVQTANSWRIGDPLPPELRRLRESKSDLADPMDSSALIAQVSNLPLLAALVLDPGADVECREDSLSQGIRVGGPNRFFGLVRSQLSVGLPNNIQPWINDVRDRMTRPHAVVDALFISYNDMAQKEALAVIAGITNDLRRGVLGPKFTSSIRRNSATLQTPRLELAPKSGFSDLSSFFPIQRWEAAT